MRYTVTSDFTTITESGGTIQNTSNIFTIEVSAFHSKDSGILVYPLNTVTFRGSPVYVRCTENASVDVRVVTFTVGGSSSSSVDPNTVVIDGVTYTIAGGDQADSVIDTALNGSNDVPIDDNFNSTLDDIFNGNGTATSSGDPNFDSMLDNIFNP